MIYRDGQGGSSTRSEGRGVCTGHPDSLSDDVADKSLRACIVRICVNEGVTGEKVAGML